MSSPETQAKAARAAQARIGPARRAWWYFCRKICRVWFAVCYRLRVEGRAHSRHALGRREDGSRVGTLYLANHQSFFDPIIVGLGTKRPYISLARKSLWNNPVLGWLFTSLGGIPVDQENPDASTMKRCIEVLEAGEDLLIFPEGSRGRTAQVQALQPGVMLIMKRAKPVVVPVALAGAFAAWPRKAKLPRFFGRIAVRLGEPRPAEAYLAVKPAEALESLRVEIDGLRVGLGVDPIP